MTLSLVIGLRSSILVLIILRLRRCIEFAIFRQSDTLDELRWLFKSVGFACLRLWLFHRNWLQATTIELLSFQLHSSRLHMFIDAFGTHLVLIVLGLKWVVWFYTFERVPWIAFFVLLPQQSNPIMWCADLAFSPFQMEWTLHIISIA